MQQINKPIIIVGTGRCGSTLLHRLLALHENVGWLSPYNEVLPEQSWLSRFSNLYRWQPLGHMVRHLRFFPKPFESYRFWEHYLPGFSRRDRPLTAADVPTEAIEPVRRAVSRVLAHQGRSRLLVKVTGWARVAYFNRIFPEAQFIWLNREHRAVVSSWVRAGWLDVTSPPDSNTWQWGQPPAEYEALWQELGGGPLLAAALKIQLDLDDIRHNLAHFPTRAMQVQFEELITRPEETLRTICDFCGLPWTSGFARAVGTREFYDPTDKWKRFLSEEDGQRVLAFFERAEQLRPVHHG